MKKLIKGEVGELFGIKIITLPWYDRLLFWRYKRIMKGVWIRK